MADTKYFKSEVHALSVVVGDPDPTKGEVAPKTVDFQPYWEPRAGVEGPGPNKEVKVGVLATDNGSALRKLQSDPNVKEIKKDEYEKLTVATFDGEEGDANRKQLTGLKAPY